MKGILLLLLLCLTGCVSTSPTYVDPFSPRHFAQLQPGVTTRDQTIAIFGLPTTIADMAGGMAMDTWTDGMRSMALSFKNGRLEQVQTLFNIYLPDAEKRRLGILPASRKDRLVPARLALLNPGETTTEQAALILGPPVSQSVMPEGRVLLMWQVDGKAVSIGFRGGIMVRVLTVSNLSLSHAEMQRLGIVRPPSDR